MGLSVPIDPALARSIYNPQALGFTPPSAPWLSDTLNGLDLYKLGFGMTPTVYFDPAAAETSRNLGTYQNPYTTLAQVQARCSGFMGGQVLGVKRGGLVRGTLSLSCYGAIGAPFVIAPYGDALAMPVFSGGVVRTGWTAYAGDARTWQFSGITQAVDVFESGARLFAVTGANLAAKIAAIQAFIAAPIAGTPGVFALDGATLYAWFEDGVSPTLGQVETAEAANAILIAYPDVAGTGYVTVAGMTGMMTRYSAISLNPANVSGAHAPSGLQVVACQAGRAGAQLNTSLSADAFQIYGIDDAHRVSGLYLAGNYAFDTLNNAYEVAAVSSGTIERNIGWNAGGNSVAELWALCSSVTVQFNRGYNDPIASRRLSSGYHNGGVWRTNYSTVTGSASDDTKSGGAVVRFNYIQDPGDNGLDVLGGGGDSYYNNTVVAARQGWGDGWYVRGAGATGHSLTNNLFVNAAPGAGFVFFGQIDPGVATPNLDGNAYANLTNATGSGGAWRGGSNQYYDIGSWRGFTGGEAHSRATLGDATGTAFGFSGVPLASLTTSAGYSGAADYALSGSIVQGAGQPLAATAPLLRHRRPSHPQSGLAQHRLRAGLTAMIENDDALTARLIRHEGLRLKPYRDIAGNLTIGVGRNLDGAGIDRGEAMILLKNDIAAARTDMDARWPWWRKRDPVRGDVMIELTFNLGAEGFAAFTTVLSLLESGAFAAAAADLLATQWARQVGARAQELAQMIRTGIPT